MLSHLVGATPKPAPHVFEVRFSFGPQQTRRHASSTDKSEPVALKKGHVLDSWGVIGPNLLPRRGASGIILVDPLLIRALGVGPGEEYQESTKGVRDPNLRRRFRPNTPTPSHGTACICHKDRQSDMLEGQKKYIICVLPLPPAPKR